MSTEPLPYSPYLYCENISPTERVSRTMYTAEQMRAYALAERYACAALCDERANDENDAQWCADAIRARD